MPFVTPADQGQYDVIIVGSGAAGGQAAYTLTLEGASADAGGRAQLRSGDGDADVPERRQAPLRGTATPDKPFGFYDATVDGGWQVPGEPYTERVTTMPRDEFRWWRARMLGGRTNHWGRISLRNGPYDFKPRSRDGLGFDWPITYEDVEPYYDKVEMLIGVYGDERGAGEHAGLARGLPAAAAQGARGRAADRRSTRRSSASRSSPIHRAVLTQQHDYRTIPAEACIRAIRRRRDPAEGDGQRAACFWATPCGRGCSIGANYQSTTVHLPPALATGNLDIVPNAMVREVTLDKDGKATGVIFIDKTTGTEQHASRRASSCSRPARARRCASCSTRRSARFPQRLANSSGMVGKYIMDTVGASVGGQIPALENLPPHNEDGAGGGHVYVPWWLYKEQNAGKLDFARGYHIEFGGGRQMPGIGADRRASSWLTRRQLRPQVQGGRAPLLRLVRRLRRAAAR